MCRKSDSHNQQQNTSSNNDDNQRNATTAIFKDKVCIIGSGNWGSAISVIIGKNCERLHNYYESEVKMWVHEEMIDNGKGKSEKLSTIINTANENIKYLPGIKLPKNIVAEPNLALACQNATLLIFVLPHQFLPKLLPTIKQSVHPTNCRGVSLIKGIDFDPKTKLPILISKSIEDHLSGGRPLGYTKFECGVLMGANVASEVAMGQLCESTLASNFGGSNSNNNSNHRLNERTRLLFHSSNHFRVQHIKDVIGAETCGALKNVVALGAGFVDGIDQLGSNTKAALIRIGLREMEQFCYMFYGVNTNSCDDTQKYSNNCNNNDDNEEGSSSNEINNNDNKNNAFSSIQSDTFTQSCGVADLITTCYSGRNRKCAEAFAREYLSLSSSSLVVEGKENKDNNMNLQMKGISSLSLSQSSASLSSVKPSQQSNGSSSSSATKLQKNKSEYNIEIECEKLWSRIEYNLLNGQKLQGTITCKEVYSLLHSRNVLHKFPLMKIIYEIAFLGKSIHKIVDGIKVVDTNNTVDDNKENAMIPSF